MYTQYMSDRWYMRQWDWEWLVTLEFKTKISRERAVYRLKNWLLKLEHKERMQVGGWYCYAVKDGQAHVHVVLLGRDKNGRTLSDVDCQKWERAWAPRRIVFGVNRPATIEVPRSSKAVCSYLAMHNFEWKADEADIQYYNGRLLFKKLRPKAFR